jgi:hypothetical protein
MPQVVPLLKSIGYSGAVRTKQPNIALPTLLAESWNASSSFR